MAGRIDDIDLHALVAHAGDFAKNGDAALALEIVGIHDAFDGLLVVAEDAALVKHGIDQRGFPVIDVGDDGDVADGGVADFHRLISVGRVSGAAGGGPRAFSLALWPPHVMDLS